MKKTWLVILEKGAIHMLHENIADTIEGAIENVYESLESMTGKPRSQLVRVIGAVELSDIKAIEYGFDLAGYDLKRFKKGDAFP